MKEGDFLKYKGGILDEDLSNYIITNKSYKIIDIGSNHIDLLLENNWLWSFSIEEIQEMFSYEFSKKDIHYDNTNGSLYLFANQHELNAYEFDVIKRIVRCRKKGQFRDDLEKSIRVIELYLKETE
jgi:hypothetical protein